MMLFIFGLMENMFFLVVVFFKGVIFFNILGYLNRKGFGFGLRIVIGV